MGFIWHPLLPFAKHQQIKPGPKTQIVPRKSRKTRGGNTGAGKSGCSKELWPFERKTFAEEQSRNSFLSREIPRLLICSYCWCQRRSTKLKRGRGCEHLDLIAFLLLNVMDAAPFLPFILKGSAQAASRFHSGQSLLLSSPSHNFVSMTPRDAQNLNSVEVYHSFYRIDAFSIISLLLKNPALMEKRNNRVLL